MIRLRYEWRSVKQDAVFYFLTVLGPQFRRQEGNSKHRQWCCVCRCKCGAVIVVSPKHLVSGHTRSCGRKTASHGLIGASTRHGESHTALHDLWLSMRRRCDCQNASNYDRYGGRGIRVCSEWDVSYESFRDWALANGYRDGLQIDRRNNSGNYEPGNCHFVTGKTNCRNTRRNLLLKAFDEIKAAVEWVEDSRCVVSYDVLVRRVHLGHDPEIALTVPSGKLRMRR